jgi:hypothetical protein
MLISPENDFGVSTSTLYRGGAAQPSRGKRNEKSGKPPLTFSKRKTPTSEDPHMVVGSGKSINLLFSQREDFKITP